MLGIGEPGKQKNGLNFSGIELKCFLIYKMNTMMLFILTIKRL